MTFTVTLNVIVLKMFISLNAITRSVLCSKKDFYYKKNVKTFWTSNFVVFFYDIYSKRYC